MAQDTNAPFGVATKRFNKIGFHPDLDKTGSMRKTINLIGPGHYNPEKFECVYKKYNIGGSRSYTGNLYKIYFIKYT